MVRNGWLCLILACLASIGCSSGWRLSGNEKRPLRRPPPAHFPAHEIKFADSNGFDMMLESALLSKRPSIVIQTDAKSPDEIDERVQAWVSAWMDGGELDVPNSKGLGAGQAILLGLDIANSREFDEFMSNAHRRAKVVADWYNDRKVKEKRVDLLRPYVLAFDNPKDGGPIQIRLYNGLYDQIAAVEGGEQRGDAEKDIANVDYQETAPDED